MRCRTARKMIFEDGLGLLTGEDAGRLQEHCDLCRPCQAAHRSSIVLDRSFAELGAVPAPAVDVCSQVLLQLPGRRQTKAPGFAWALTGAVAASAAFLVLTLNLAPHALPLLRAGFHGAGALVRSAAPLLTLGSALIQLGSLLTRPLFLLGDAFAAVQPLAWNILIAGACAAAAVSLIIVSRGFLQQEPAATRKEI